MIRRLITLFAILTIGLATFNQASASTYQQKPAAAHMKKDGTPDKRYKENKAPKGPTKKDGTADMRYKANKPKPKK